MDSDDAALRGETQRLSIEDQPLASRLRAALLDLLETHDRLGGSSRDRYASSPTYHAMADGKFLSALALARKLDYIDESTYRSRLEAAESRLVAHSLDSSDDLACWGLGFAYGGCGADEPYLITTAVVTHGLIDNRDSVDPILLRRAVGWLASYRFLDDVQIADASISLPRFSPRTPNVVTNAAAYWAAALHRSGMELPPAIAHSLAWIGRWLASEFDELGGWTYARGNPRVDLLHQCYILAGALRILPRPDAERMALRTLSRFQTPRGWIDKLDFVTEEKALERAARSSEVSLVPGERDWVVVHHEAARLWSLGELAVVTARLAREGENASYWRTMLRRLASRILDILALEPRTPAPEEVELRQTAHIAHGIASMLDTLVAERTEEAGVHSTIEAATTDDRAYYDRLAAEYFARHEQPIQRFATRVESSWLRKLVPPGSRVLLVGAGGGRELRALLDLDCRITCLDYSQPMIERGRAHWNDPHIEWVLGDAHDLRRFESRFDCIVCLAAVNYFFDVRLALEEMHRALANGGRLLLSSINRLHGTERSAAPCGKYHRRLFSPRELIAIACDAGFVLEEVRGLRYWVDHLPARWNRAGRAWPHPVLKGMLFLERVLGTPRGPHAAKFFWVVARK